MMRWKRKTKKYSKDGDKRIVTKFLVLPLKIDDDYMWLEKAKIKQSFILAQWTRGIWINLEFID